MSNLSPLDETPESVPPVASPLGGANAQSSPLDDGTFTELKEPRNALQIPLDGSWHQISPRYVTQQLLFGVLTLAVLIAGTVVAGINLGWWTWLAGGVLILLELISLIILPRQARALGYMLRDDDVVFRRGILWQRFIAVPYGRLQLVDILQGPIDRAFGIAKLKMITAAATTNVTIDGLTFEAAEALRDTLIAVAETRRGAL